MKRPDASIRPDGSCRLVSQIDGIEVTWASVEQWAADWLVESQAGRHGRAGDFIQAACDDAVPGVVDR